MLLRIATAAVAAGIFVVDTVLAHDLAVGVVYIVVVLMASRFCMGRTLLLVGAGCVALIILGYLLSPPAASAVYALLNLMLRSAGIGVATLLVWQSQSARAASRERENLLDLTHDTIFVRDIDDVITYWNCGAEDLYGWTRDEAIGKVSHLLMQTIFPAPLAEINAELLRTGRWEGELIHTKRDRTRITVASRWALERDKQERPARIFETNNDVTERKRAEQELRASEARFRTFVDHATDAFLLLDEDWTVLDVNRQACAGLGYSREELIGRHKSDFDVSLDDTSIQRLKQRMIAGEAMTFETRHRRKDGTSFPVEVRVGQFEQGGRRFLCLVRDITERKRAEDELRDERGALSYPRSILLRRVLGDRRAASLYPPGVRRRPCRRAGAGFRDRQDALGNALSGA